MKMPAAGAVARTPLFRNPSPGRGRTWRKYGVLRRPNILLGPGDQLITPGAKQKSRRQTLLLGAAPVWCCAACRSPVLDRLFAESMAEGMADYEAAIAPVKRMLFGRLAEGLQPQLGRPANVLEIGIGTGPNLGFYPPGGEVSITGVDPNPFMLPYLRSKAQQLGWPDERLEWVEGLAEALPLPDASMDAVVCTLVLCSVPDVPAVLQEVHRVLRPGGAFLFIEHTVAPQSRPLLRLGQRMLDPLQQFLADGCHLTRDPLPAIQAAGFEGVDASRFQVDGMSLIAPHVAGIARA